MISNRTGIECLRDHLVIQGRGHDVGGMDQPIVKAVTALAAADTSEDALDALARFVQAVNRVHYQSQSLVGTERGGWTRAEDAKAILKEITPA